MVLDKLNGLALLHAHKEIKLDLPQMLGEQRAHEQGGQRTWFPQQPSSTDPHFQTIKNKKEWKLTVHHDQKRRPTTRGIHPWKHAVHYENVPKRRIGHRTNKQAAKTPVTAAGQVGTANVTKAGTGTAVTRAERVIWMACT